MQESTATLIDEIVKLQDMQSVQSNLADQPTPERQHDARYQALFRQLPEAVMVFDAAGNMLDLSERATTLLGMSRQALMSQTLHQAIPQLPLDAAQALMQAEVIGQQFVIQLELTREDGSLFPAEVRISVIALEQGRALMATLRDISAMRRQEKVLQERVAFNESLLQTMTVPVFYKDAQGVYTGCNNAFANFIGKRKNEIIGKTVFDIAPQPLSPIYRDKDLELLEDPLGVQIYESRVKHADGTIHDVIFHKARITSSGGKAVGIIGAILDISERKRYEKEQQNLIHQLEEKELAKTRFLASAGHDLRQPVSAASLFVQALKLTSPTPAQQEVIEKLDESMKTFSDLLEQLLNISRFDAGLIRPEPSSFNLAQLFSWLADNFVQEATDKNLKLIFHLPKNRGMILNTDIGLLKSVLMNLLSNAIKFTQTGGILVSARVRTGQALIQVWDTGMGIPQENFAHIFDEFYQINNPQRDRNRGLGLGLSIVRRALTLLDSEIMGCTELGKGTVFSFSLPLHTSQHHVPHHAAAELVLEDMLDDSFTRGKCFVVVEDDALVAQGMISWLEGMGAQVMFFLKAEDALASPRIGEADCFIADYMLGGKYNGIEFLQRLREQLGTQVTAVLVTGDTSPDFVQAATQCEWPVLYKPVKPARLIVTLRTQHELFQVTNNI